MKRIVVVTTDDILESVVDLALGGPDVQVLQANGLEDCRSCAQKLGVQVVFVDDALPEGAAEAIALLRGDPVACRVPNVLVCHGDAVDRQARLAATGADELLVGPLNTEELPPWLENVLASLGAAVTSRMPSALTPASEADGHDVVVEQMSDHAEDFADELLAVADAIAARSAPRPPSPREAIGESDPLGELDAFASMAAPAPAPVAPAPPAPAPVAPAAAEAIGELDPLGELDPFADLAVPAPPAPSDAIRDLDTFFEGLLPPAPAPVAPAPPAPVPVAPAPPAPVPVAPAPPAPAPVAPAPPAPVPVAPAPPAPAPVAPAPPAPVPVAPAPPAPAPVAAPAAPLPPPAPPAPAPQFSVAPLVAPLVPEAKAPVASPDSAAEISKAPEVEDLLGDDFFAVAPPPVTPDIASLFEQEIASQAPAPPAPPAPAPAPPAPVAPAPPAPPVPAPAARPSMPDLLTMLNEDMAASLKSEAPASGRSVIRAAIPEIFAGGCMPRRSNEATAVRFTDDMPADTVATFLRTGDGATRRAAIHWLAAHRAHSALQELSTLLTDPDPEIVEAGVLAIGAIGDSMACSVVGRMLSSSDERIRRAAMVALGEIADDSTCDLLAHVLLDHEDERYRAGAAYVMGKRELHRGKAALQSAFDDPSPAVRATARQAFDQL